MDVILARLDPRQLRVYCSDAMQQELKTTFELLGQALAALKRAEEVQVASHKLAVQEFQRDANLLQMLEEIDSLRLQFCISIDHIMRGARGEMRHVQHDVFPDVKDEDRVRIQLHGVSPHKVVDAGSDVNAHNIIDLSAVQEAVAPAIPAPVALSSRKRKLSISSTTEQQQPASSSSSAAKKFIPEYKQIAAQNRLGKSIHAAMEYSNEIMKRKAGDRVQGLPVFSSKLNVVVKNIESAEYGEVGKAMESLNHLISVAVNVVVKAKPAVKRQVAVKKLKVIQKVQTKFPEFANLFEKSYTSLCKYIDLTFRLPVKETEELRRRIRASLTEAKAWEAGTYSVPDFQEKMKIVKRALDCNCEGWNAHKDPTVLELLDLLVARLSGFKDSQMQEKRKETLQAWRAEMKVAKPQGKSKPSSVSAKAQKRSQSKQPRAKSSKASEKKGAVSDAKSPSSSAKPGNKAPANGSAAKGAKGQTQQSEPKRLAAVVAQKETPKAETEPSPFATPASQPKK